MPAIAVPPREPSRPGVWSGLGTVALYFLFQLGAGLVLGFLMAFFAAMSAVMHGETFSAAQVAELLRTPSMLVWLTVVTIIVAAGLSLWLCHRFWTLQWRGPNPPGFGFTLPGQGWWFLVAIAVGIGIVFFNGMMTQLLAHGSTFQQDVTKMGLEVGVWPRLGLGLAVVLVAPLVEELLFRGVLLSGLMRRMPVIWAVLVSAVLFGCVHFPDFKFAWFPIPGLILFGAVLAWLRLRSRSLWVSITAHATNNAIGVIAWFVMAASAR